MVTTKAIMITKDKNMNKYQKMCFFSDYQIDEL